MTLSQHEFQIIKEVRQMIDENVKNRIPIADLAASHNISESALAKGFKTVYHKTIYKYRLEKCMEYAKQLIENGTPVKVLVIELGYKNNSSFSRAFKKVFFQVPSKYLPDYVTGR